MPTKKWTTKQGRCHIDEENRTEIVIMYFAIKMSYIYMLYTDEYSIGERVDGWSLRIILIPQCRCGDEDSP